MATFNKKIIFLLSRCATTYCELELVVAIVSSFSSFWLSRAISRTAFWCAISTKFFHVFPTHQRFVYINNLIDYKITRGSKHFRMLSHGSGGYQNESRGYQKWFLVPSLLDWRFLGGLSFLGAFFLEREISSDDYLLLYSRLVL